MKCHRAFDADLPSLLEGHGDDPEFLTHYGTCPDCAAEVGAWRELHGLLRVGITSTGTHPSAEELLTLVDRPDSLGIGERAALERHVASCRPCGDETRLLRTIDVATAVANIDVAAESEPTLASAVAPPASAASLALPVSVAESATVAAPIIASAPAAVPAAASAPAPVSTPVRGGRLARVIWHPAFAYGLAVILVLPLLRQQLVRLTAEPEHTALVIRRTEPEEPPAAEAPKKAEAPAAAEAPPPSSDVVSAPAEGVFQEALGRQLGAVAERHDDLNARGDQAVPVPPPQASRPVPLSRAAAPAGAAPGAAAAPPESAAASPRTVLDVSPEAFPALPLAVASEGARLRIATPPAVGAGVVDVRVRRRNGGRELFERLPAQADAIELDIPRDWLLPGDYEVTVEAADGRRRAGNAEARAAGDTEARAAGNTEARAAGNTEARAARHAEADSAPRGRLRFSVGPSGSDEGGVAGPGAPR